MNGINYIILLRIDQRAESRKERADIRSAQTEWKRQERQKQIEQGKKPFFRRQVNRLLCPKYVTLVITQLFFSRILQKNIENRGKQRNDRKWIQDRLRNRTRKKSKNRLKKKRKICQRDENWNKRYAKFIYPTILSSIFTCLSSKTRKNYWKMIFCVYYSPYFIGY